MTGSQQKGAVAVRERTAAVTVESVLTELRGIVRDIEPVSSQVAEEYPNHAEAYTKELVQWLDYCMHFALALVREQGVRFGSSVPDKPASGGWFLRYLGAVDAWLGVVLGVMHAHSQKAKADAGPAEGLHRWIDQWQCIGELVNEFRKVLVAVPPHIALKEGGGRENDGGQTVPGDAGRVGNWMLSCARCLDARASELGSRFAIELPDLDGGTERFYGALSAWLNFFEDEVLNQR